MLLHAHKKARTRAQEHAHACTREHRTHASLLSSCLSYLPSCTQSSNSSRRTATLTAAVGASRWRGEATHPPAGRNQCAKRAHNSWPASERERARSAPSHTPHSPRSIPSTCLAKSGRRRVAGARVLAGGGDAPCWPRTTVSKSGMCTAHLLACEQAPGTHAARPINTRIPTTLPNSSNDQTLGVTALPGRVCWRRWAGAPKPAAPADANGGLRCLRRGTF